MLRGTTRRLKKQVRRYLAQPLLQHPFRLLYRVALAGMNYGGAGSDVSAGDAQGLLLLRTRAHPVVVFDVGANVGGYIEHVVQSSAPAPPSMHSNRPGQPSRSSLGRSRQTLGCIS